MAPQVPNRSSLMLYSIFVLAGPATAWDTLKSSLYYETSEARVLAQESPCTSDG